MKFDGAAGVPYRIGIAWDLNTIRSYAIQGDWRSVRYVVFHRVPRNALHRSWWGLWQAEWPGCTRAVRGFTAVGTAAKARRRMLKQVAA